MIFILSRGKYIIFQWNNQQTLIIKLNNISILKTDKKSKSHPRVHCNMCLCFAKSRVFPLIKYYN
jgi:hypothetical protein